MTSTITVSDDLRLALDRVADGLAAMGSGDPAPYAALWADGPDVTLFGAWGPIERGHDAVTRTFEWVGSRFSDGALVPRHDVVHADGDRRRDRRHSRRARSASTAASRGR